MNRSEFHNRARRVMLCDRRRAPGDRGAFKRRPLLVRHITSKQPRTVSSQDEYEAGKRFLFYSDQESKCLSINIAGWQMTRIVLFCMMAVAVSVAGAAPGCSIVCSNKFEPVCGSDGTTYTSQCYIEANNCATGAEVTKAYDGFCVPGPCDAEYRCRRNRDTVCGTNDRTYLNACIMEQMTCGQYVTVKHKGKC